VIDFPANPTVGQQFTAAGVTWVWDGVKWLPSGLSPTVVPGIGDNRLINGDMRIDQRNAGALVTPTAGQYVIDRWAAGLTQAGKFTAQRLPSTIGGALPALGFTYFLSLVSTSVYTLLVGDQFTLRQPIEADFCADFGWGTTGAQPVTLSFFAFSSLTGTFGGVITNGPVGTATRSYPFSFNIPTANIWTKIVVTIPGDSLVSSTNWVLQGNGVGVVLWFGLGVGATLSAPAGAWANGDFRSANGAVSLVGTSGASLNFAGIKLEIGSVATPYNRPTMAKALADCQRYYQTFGYNSGGYAAAGAYTQASGSFPVQMRASPTIAFASSPTYTNCSGLTASGGPAAFTPVLTVTAAGGFLASATYQASAEF
jgi:hypothetical protein